jgi:hypothetical protein
LPSKYVEGTKVFDERVKARFPIGMSEVNLIQELRNQGFSIDRKYFDHESATITRGLVLRTIWSVRWRAKAGRVEEVWGIYGVIAP